MKFRLTVGNIFIIILMIGGGINNYLYYVEYDSNPFYHEDFWSIITGLLYIINCGIVIAFLGTWLVDNWNKTLKL